MNKYMLRRDTDGSVYLAHAYPMTRNRQAPVKYIAKIGEGSKSRYFYTQEQLRAYQQGKTKQPAKATAAKKSATTMKVGTVPGTSITTMRKTTDIGQEFKNRAAERAKKAKDKVKEKTGIKARDELIKANKNYAKAVKELNTGEKTAEKVKKFAEAAAKSNKALEEYEKTPLGKATAAKAIAEDKLADAKAKTTEVKDEAKTKLKSTSDKMKDEFRKKQEERNKKKQKTSDNEIKEEVIKENVITENIIPEKIIKENINSENKNKDKKITMSKLNELQRHRLDAYDFVYNNVDSFNSKATKSERQDAYSLVNAISVAEDQYLNGNIDYDTYQEIVNKAEKELHNKYDKYK